MKLSAGYLYSNRRKRGGGVLLKLYFPDERRIIPCTEKIGEYYREEDVSKSLMSKSLNKNESRQTYDKNDNERKKSADHSNGGP